MRDQQPVEHSPIVRAVSPSPTADSTAPVERAPMPVRDYAFYRAAFAGRDLPLAYVDLDLLDANVGAVCTRAGDKRVRIASKSVRCVALLRHLFAAALSFQGVMCYTPSEAVYLASLGFSDLLLGYPTGSAADLDRIARATADGASITLMVDCREHIEQAESAARRHGVRLPLCVDMDMTLALPGLHFGVWRSPLRSADQVRPLIQRIVQSSQVWLDGIMGYEAQIAGVGDRYPGQALKNALVWQLKRRSARLDAQRRAEIVALAHAEGVTPRFVNGGGTGSIASTRLEPAVTEITVGSAFYGPALFDNYRGFRYLPAAGFAIQIVRQPAPAIYTCQGGGYTASGGAGRDKLPQPYLPVGARLDPLEAAGEVQTPIHYAGHERLALGDPILMRHAKAGELCERFTHLLLVRGGQIVDEVTTYRGDGQCFL